jgi:hypothetical protein
VVSRLGRGEAEGSPQPADETSAAVSKLKGMVAALGAAVPAAEIAPEPPPAEPVTQAPAEHPEPDPAAPIERATALVDGTIRPERELIASVAQLRALPLLPPEVGSAVIFAARAAPAAPTPIEPPAPEPQATASEPAAAAEPPQQPVLELDAADIVTVEPAPAEARAAQDAIALEAIAQDATAEDAVALEAVAPEAIAEQAIVQETGAPEVPAVLQAAQETEPATAEEAAPATPEPAAVLADPDYDLSAFLFGPDLDPPDERPPPAAAQIPPSLPNIDLVTPAAEPKAAEPSAAETPQPQGSQGSPDPLAPLNAMSPEERLALFS